MKAPAVIPKVCRHVLLCILDFSVGQPPLPPLTPNGWVLHHSLKLIAKFTFKLKKVGKTSRPFRYDLNEIPYDYIVGLYRTGQLQHQRLTIIE